MISLMLGIDPTLQCLSALHDISGNKLSLSNVSTWANLEHLLYQDRQIPLFEPQPLVSFALLH